MPSARVFAGILALTVWTAASGTAQQPDAPPPAAKPTNPLPTPRPVPEPPNPADAIATAAKSQLDAETDAIKARAKAEKAAIDVRAAGEKTAINARADIQLASLAARVPTQAAALKATFDSQKTAAIALLDARVIAEKAVIDQRVELEVAAVKAREVAAAAAVLRGGLVAPAGFGGFVPPLGMGGFGVTREVTVVQTGGLGLDLGAGGYGMPLGFGGNDVVLRLSKRLYHPTCEAVERFNRADYSGACHHLAGALEVIVPELKRYAAEGSVPVALCERAERDFRAAYLIKSSQKRVIALRAVANDITAEYWRAKEAAEGRSYFLERLGGEVVLTNVSRSLAGGLTRDSSLRLADGSDALVPALLTAALVRGTVGTEPASCYPAGVTRGQVVSIARLLDVALRENSVPEYEIREVWSRHKRYSPYPVFDE